MQLYVKRGVRGVSNAISAFLGGKYRTRAQTDLAILDRLPSTTARRFADEAPTNIILEYALEQSR